MGDLQRIVEWLKTGKIPVEVAIEQATIWRFFGAMAAALGILILIAWALFKSK